MSLDGKTRKLPPRMMRKIGIFLALVVLFCCGYSCDNGEFPPDFPPFSPNHSNL